MLLFHKIIFAPHMETENPKRLLYVAIIPRDNENTSHQLGY